MLFVCMVVYLALKFGASEKSDFELKMEKYEKRANRKN